MKTTLKEFLKEQHKLGMNVPKIFEGMSFGPEGTVNDDFEEPDFEGWIDTDISGPTMSAEISNLIDKIIDRIKKEVTKKFGQPNPKVEKDMAKLTAQLWMDRINDDLINLNKFNNEDDTTIEPTEDQIQEGWFDKVKNKLNATLEVNVTEPYEGSPEAQAFVTKDRVGKLQIQQIQKYGLTPEQAISVVKYVFDKSDKNGRGFVGKKTTFDKVTNTLTIANQGGLNPNLAA